MVRQGTIDSPLRIACVGDSITWGALIWRRKRDCYPARLQRLLGDGVIVGNFGSVGHTAQTSADLPYENSKPYRASSGFAPDVALIMLGTNDAKENNWNGIEKFIEDYRALIGHYRALPSSPRIVLMTPPSVYAKGRSGKIKWGIEASAIDEMCGAIHSLAGDERFTLIDVHAATAGHPEAFRFDGIHPGPDGAELIAQAAFGSLVHSLKE
ncbi:MAG: hypothetical protein HZB44_04825 [Actinobacteria bacterium]|nr:hypothetical protein [Actinomycetota bacterium]